MLSKAFATTSKQMLARPQNLMPLATRGVYTADTKPYVFINEHTKVLVQGMTGKHVSNSYQVKEKVEAADLSCRETRQNVQLITFLRSNREPSTLSNQSPMALKLLEE